MKRTKSSVELLHNTPLRICDIAIGTCWDKHGDECNVKRIDRVVNKFKHESTVECLSYNFYIKNISRALLQEIARTRIASPSVKSSRYTLKELKDEEAFILDVDYNGKDFNITVESDEIKRASKYIFFTGDEYIDKKSILELEVLRTSVKSGKANDITKYNLPDCYLTEMSFTINARSLRNLLSLRTSTSALLEYRELSRALSEAIPEDHLFLFIDCLNLPNIYELVESDNFIEWLSNKNFLNIDKEILTKDELLSDYENVLSTKEKIEFLRNIEEVYIDK